jgi:arsenite methyltransferase
MTIHDDDAVHSAVQDRYGALARRLNMVQPKATCCGETPAAEDDCGCSPRLYDETLLEGLPVDVTGLSLGCGDPVTMAELRAGDTVLDLGSGGGIDCFLAARQVGDIGYVIGVDMTPDMLARANASKTQMGVQNVEFREGHIEALPVDDNSIDVVMSNCVINLSPDKSAVFAEALRVLRPGGRIALSDIVTEGEFSPKLRADLSQWSECVTGAIDAEAYIDLMRAAGFVDIQIVDKVNANKVIEKQDGMPRIFSARVTAFKPQPE